MTRGELLRVLVLLVLVAGCRSPSSPAADAGAAAACANLARLGCTLGSDPACPSRLELAASSEHRIEPKDVTCASSATSKDELVHCSPYFSCP